jgi:hypothetical protein
VTMNNRGSPTPSPSPLRWRGEHDAPGLPLSAAAGRGQGGGGKLRHGALIAFGVLGGAVAWITHLMTVYALLPVACLTGTGLVIHLTTLLFGGVAVGAIVVSARGWQRPNAGSAERWLGAAGLLLNAIFLFAILVEGAAAFVVDPCL